MNQILHVQEKKNTSKTIDTKKVVLFFSISIIVFGLIMLGQGIHTLSENKQNAKAEPVPEPIQEYITTITFISDEDNKVAIHIESDIAISHVLYRWNNDATQTIDENGKTSMEEVIDIPVGENTLHVTAIDSNGKETKESKDFILEVSKPVIELSVVGNYIKITVTSETELSYMTYKWNNETEKRENMYTYEDKTKLEKRIEIPKGQNTLKIVAVDKNGNTTEKSQDIRGITKAKTTVVAKGKYLHFTVTGEENIKLVEFVFNGETYIMNTSTFGETATVHYKKEMKEGWNYLKVISTTQSGAQDTSVWKYEYKAQ